MLISEIEAVNIAIVLMILSKGPFNLPNVADFYVSKCSEFKK